MNPTPRPTKTPRQTPRAHARKVAGAIYCVATHTDPMAYVGQSSGPPGKRVDVHRARQPWGPQIMPGRAGYRIVEWVESSGNPTIDAILLDLAEAKAIQHLNPTYNDIRPDPTIFVARLAAARNGTLPTTPRRPAPRRPATTPRRRTRSPWGLVARGVVGLVWLIVGLRLCAPLADPTAAWVVVPVVVVLGTAVTLRVFVGRPTRRRRRPTPKRTRRRSRR